MLASICLDWWQGALIIAAPWIFSGALLALFLCGAQDDPYEVHDGYVGAEDER
jgi:hypothetical protein